MVVIKSKPTFQNELNFIKARVDATLLFFMRISFGHRNPKANILKETRAAHGTREMSVTQRCKNSKYKNQVVSYT